MDGRSLGQTLDMVRHEVTKLKPVTAEVRALLLQDTEFFFGFPLGPGHQQIKMKSGQVLAIADASIFDGTVLLSVRYLVNPRTHFP
jgi:hypothetical protein